MSEDFYPFVDSGDPAPDNQHLTGVAGKGDPAAPGPTATREGGRAAFATRISVYDDLLSTPRVIVIERDDVRTYLEEITNTVYRTMKEQGGRLSLMVIRELVENFIHARFVEPVISILDGGNTIRFADQGPGIADKERAFEFGVTSADRDQKRYIRGTGSGLPMVQEYLQNAGGAISIEDNLGQGTVVTVSVDAARVAEIGQTVSRGAAVRPSGARQAAGGVTAVAYPPNNTGAYPYQQAAIADTAGYTAELPPAAGGTPNAGYPGMQPTGAWNAGQAGTPGPAEGTAGSTGGNWPGSISGAAQSSPGSPGVPLAPQGMWGASAPVPQPGGWPSPLAGGMPVGYPPIPPGATPPTPGYQQWGHQFFTTQQFPVQNGYQAAPVGSPASSGFGGQTVPEVSERGLLALQFLVEQGTCGPTALAGAFGESVPTWSRELATLASMGLIRKHGQKHILTDMGKAWLQQHSGTQTS